VLALASLAFPYAAAAGPLPVQPNPDNRPAGRTYQDVRNPDTRDLADGTATPSDAERSTPLVAVTPPVASSGHSGVSVQELAFAGLVALASVGGIARLRIRARGSRRVRA
jgi:hypothetical protein